ncbi:carbohydrate ABC transporter permease [Roseateles asaccharophilus]|uniref:Glucose/mannose transport system permease protein n=1 Tax=Roseateles asaccharophilus TaxID=582607 RepID=A0ABU2AE98_9BURK|nr:carbohydrate ABC transporter permease [Roseateles asaccharophilus]MDR7335526.1 glucose/mannose transport system permease protein [Roseateles asaccharophilus]
MKRAGLYLLAALAVLLIALPLLLMLLNSVKSSAEVQGGFLAWPREPSLAAWRQAWSQLSGSFTASLMLAVPAVLLSALLAAVNGFVLCKYRFRGERWVGLALVLAFFLPIKVYLLPLAITMARLGLERSLPLLIAIHVIYSLPLALFFRNHFLAFPDELLQAARLDGAGFWRLLWRVVLPLSKPIFVVVLILQFTTIWNEYLFGLVFGPDGARPITAALAQLSAQTETGARAYPLEMAAALLAAAPTLVVYLLAGRHFTRGLVAGAVKG